MSRIFSAHEKARAEFPTKTAYSAEYGGISPGHQLRMKKPGAGPGNYQGMLDGSQMAVTFDLPPHGLPGVSHRRGHPPAQDHGSQSITFGLQYRELGVDLVQSGQAAQVHGGRWDGGVWVHG